VYNKSEKYEVIYFRECKSDEEMNRVEGMVLTKLNSFREVADHDGFILPDDTTSGLKLFTKVVDDAVSFFE